MSAKDAKALALYGVTLGLMNFVFYQAINKLPLGIAIAIEFTGPLTVAVVLSRRVIDFVWIGLTLSGLGLLLPLRASETALNPQGVAFALASALLWALYIVFGKRLGHLHSGRATALGMTIAAITIFPLGLAESGARLFQPNLILPGIGLAIASSAIPYSLEMFALKRLPKKTFGILLSMEPAVGALTGFFILHEILSWTQWLAIACIMIASIGTALDSKKRSTETSLADIPADAL